MDTASRGRFDRVARLLDVTHLRSRERADGRILDGCCHGVDGFEIAGAGSSESGFNHVYAHFFELLADANFFLLGHGSARALLAVAHSGIKNDQLVHCILQNLVCVRVTPNVELQIRSNLRARK